MVDGFVTQKGVIFCCSELVKTAENYSSFPQQTKKRIKCHVEHYFPCEKKCWLGQLWIEQLGKTTVCYLSQQNNCYLSTKELIFFRVSSLQIIYYITPEKEIIKMKTQCTKAVKELLKKGFSKKEAANLKIKVMKYTQLEQLKKQSQWSPFTTSV